MESKRLTTRIGEDTHRRMKVQAAYYGRSMEEIIEEALQEWLTAVEEHPSVGLGLLTPAKEEQV